MSEEASEEIYEIKCEYTDSGIQMVYDMEDWYEKIERDFASFDDLKDFYRTKPKSVENTLLKIMKR